VLRLVDYIWFSYQAATSTDSSSMIKGGSSHQLDQNTAFDSILPVSPASHTASASSGIGSEGIESIVDFALKSGASSSAVMTTELDATNNSRSKRRRNHATASFLSAVESNIAAAMDNIRLAAAAAAAAAKEASSQHSILKGVRVKRQKQSDMGQSVLDGFILSAGLDQRVFLWSLSGRCVGQFGCNDWDINSDATWFKEAQQDAAKKRATAQQGVTLRFDRDKTSACNIVPDTDIRDLVQSPSMRMLQADLGQKVRSSHELNSYVVTLSKKLAQKSAIYSDADGHFRYMLVRLTCCSTHAC